MATLNLDTDIDITGYSNQQIEDVIDDTTGGISLLENSLGTKVNGEIVWGTTAQEIKNKIDNMLQAEDPRKFSKTQPLNAKAWFKIRS